MVKVLIAVLAVLILLNVLLLIFFLRRLKKTGKTAVPEEIPSPAPAGEGSSPMDKMLVRSMLAFSKAIEAKDSYTSGHSKRVAEYAMEISRRMGFSEKEQRQIYYAGLLHDIGKIRVPDKIIRKRGSLSDMEFEYLKLHPVISYNIIKGISDSEEIEKAVKFHHEHYDGSGYPDGLKGESIPLWARILCVADIYDAMTSSRNFRPLFPQKFVRAEIESQAGKQLDPGISKIMLQIIDEDKDFTLKQNDTRKLKVLVVDDDVILLKLVEFMLEAEPNYSFAGTRTAKSCLNMIEEDKYDIILLDIYIPDMDGFALLEEIRKRTKAAVVFMSSDKNIETLVRADKAGVKYYLIKPFLKQELTETLGNITRSIQ